MVVDFCLQICAVQEVKEWSGQLRVDLLIHAAGVLHECENRPETLLSLVDADFFLRNLVVRSFVTDANTMLPTCENRPTANNENLLHETAGKLNELRAGSEAIQHDNDDVQN